ncbi:MAG: outer membrane beta-barrel protein [Marinirhabdus sp.]
MFRYAAVNLLVILLPALMLAQEALPKTPVDSLYREDQLYFGFTYNLFLGKPVGMNPRGLTGGLHAGYLRDMPINKKRNVAVAAGAGVSFNRYGQNLFVGETPADESIFTVIDDDLSIDFNRFSTAEIEIPIEFRWRTSTATTYKFWRVYAGVRAGYVYWYRAFFSQPGNRVSQTDIPEFDRMQLAATLSFGNSNINFFGYYSITPLFKGAVATTGENFNLRTLRLGILFYFL